MRKIQTLILVGLVVLGLACRPVNGFAASADAKARCALERRIELLEKQNQMLEQQNRTVQEQLNAQKAEIDALRQELHGAAQPAAQAQQEVPKLEQRVAKIEQRQSQVPFEVGFRAGWGESPYKMPGGFFYGAFLNHSLLTAEDGIPGGFVSGELMAGVVQGNHAVTNGNLLAILTSKASSAWLDTIEIQPTVQYHLEPALLGYPQLEWFSPYVLLGPGMYIDLLSTPIVNKGNMPSAGFRHSDADFQGGGVVGLGSEISLSALRVAQIQRILDKTHLGAEWRYNALGNGEGFNQYTGSLAFGW